MGFPGCARGLKRLARVGFEDCCGLISGFPQDSTNLWRCTWERRSRAILPLWMCKAAVELNTHFLTLLGHACMVVWKLTWLLVVLSTIQAPLYCGSQEFSHMHSKCQFGFHNSKCSYDIFFLLVLYHLIVCLYLRIQCIFCKNFICDLQIIPEVAIPVLWGIKKKLIFTLYHIWRTFYFIIYIFYKVKTKLKWEEKKNQLLLSFVCHSLGTLPGNCSALDLWAPVLPLLY